jgi:exosome complex component RRP4
MPITILAPRRAAQRHSGSRAVQASHDAGSDSDSSGGADVEGDVSMRGSKASRVAGGRGQRGGVKGGRRARESSEESEDEFEIVTPGEVITDDPQWMRYVPF